MARGSRALARADGKRNRPASCPVHAGRYDGAMTATDLSGRTVLITGASSGLGARFATVTAGAGAKVAAAARRADRLAALVGDIGPAASAIAMDVTDEASIVAGFDAGEAALGPIDTVIANAGVNLEGLAADLAIADFDALFAVNVRGVYLTAREGARRMMARGEQNGRIVLIASIGALKVLPGLAAYCASKAAVVQMGRAFAREWANRGINVNMLCPGYIETDLNAHWFASDGGKKQIAGFPRRRLMEEEDLDGLITLLCSDAARGVTGSVFVADDGQTL